MWGWISAWASWWNIAAIAVGVGAGVIAVVEPAWLDKLVPRLRTVATIVSISAFSASLFFDLGFGAAKTACNEQALRAQIASLERDLSAAKQQAARNVEHTKEIGAASGSRAAAVEKINVVVNARKPGERCNLSADDARRLRNIK